MSSVYQAQQVAGGALFAGQVYGLGVTAEPVHRAFFAQRSGEWAIFAPQLLPEVAEQVVAPAATLVGAAFIVPGIAVVGLVAAPATLVGASALVCAELFALFHERMFLSSKITKSIFRSSQI